MQNAQSVIALDDGDWHETEILHTTTPAAGGAGGKAVVRVRASISTLADLATVYRRLPKNALDDPLSDLSTAAKRALRDELEDSGYTLDEIQARFGNNIGAYTLRQVVEFAASRRQKPRYDAANDRIVCDGVVQACRDIVDIERRAFTDADWARLLSLRDTLLSEWDATQQTIRLSQRLPGLPDWERDALLVLCASAGHLYDHIRPDTFPTTGVLDNFNRGNAESLGANWTAEWWFSGTENLQDILSSQAADDDQFSVGGDYYNVATYGADAEVHCTINALDDENGSSYLIGLRITTPGDSTTDGYRSLLTNMAGTEIVRLQRGDNTVWTTLGADINQAYSVGDGLGEDAISSTHAAHRRSSGAWSSLGSRTDATYGGAGYLGLGTYGEGSVRLLADDFGGGRVVTAGVETFPPVPASRILKTSYSTLIRM